MAFPMGRPHEKYVGAVVPAGRWTELPTPRTARPSRRTRSPCGPHAKGPGVATSNRQVRPVPSSAAAHALPAETKATVAVGAGVLSSQPEGSEDTRALVP